MSISELRKFIADSKLKTFTLAQLIHLYYPTIKETNNYYYLDTRTNLIQCLLDLVSNNELRNNDILIKNSSMFEVTDKLHKGRKWPETLGLIVILIIIITVIHWVKN